MKNLLQRLNAVMGEVDYVQKERKQGMRYSIVSHDAVTGKVRPLLQKHGVVCWPVKRERSQNGNRTEMDVTIRFANIDDPADYIDVETSGYGIDDQDKGPGKAMSYAVKYAYLKALGLETGDDPDEDQNVRHEPAPRREPPKPRATTHDEDAAAVTFFAGLRSILARAPDAATLSDVWGKNRDELLKYREIAPMDAKTTVEFYKERMAELAPVAA
jgi:hypothetical protein